MVPVASSADRTIARRLPLIFLVEFRERETDLIDQRDGLAHVGVGCDQRRGLRSAMMRTATPAQKQRDEH
jgi:hypothetical protein